MWDYLYSFDWNRLDDYGRVDWLGLKTTVESWFFLYKDWEKQDTFDAAFKEGRMTARGSRSGTETNVVHNLMVQDPSGGRSMIRGLHVGFEGVAKRLAPESFADRGKYTHGLHALPAVLLDPTLSIQPQLFQDPGYVLFMPLPEEEDIQIQYNLSWAANQLNGSDATQMELLNSIKLIRRNLTRIHLADYTDMSTSFFNLGTDDQPKLRYGYAEGSDGGGAKKKPEVIAQYRLNAINYQTRRLFEKGERTKNNEVSVKYRKHAGIYPIFTRKVTKKNGDVYYQEVKNIFHPINHNRRVANRGTLEHWAWRGIIPSWVTFPGG